MSRMSETEQLKPQQQLSGVLKSMVSVEEEALLVGHLRFVLALNQKVNLTGIDDEESGLLLHIEDSLAALQEVNAAPEGRLVDLGSGGGFPGIPLAIMTGRKTTLIEATDKKARTLKKYLESAGLDGQVDIIASRIEEASKSMMGCFAVATARALSSLAAIMELASPLLMDEGVLVAYKGNVTDVEMAGARKVEDCLGMELFSRRELLLSDGRTRREILVFMKKRPAKVSLPRRNGQAQRHPFG